MLFGLLLFGCETYKRSFGVTYKTIDKHNLNKLFRLDISNQNLSSVPELLKELNKLRMLNLSGNTQLDLNNTFENLPNPEALEVLILDNLNLKSLPESIVRFKNLKHISLNFNANLDIINTVNVINELPLEFLNLQHNKLSSLSSDLSTHKTLRAINLSYNKISNNDTFRTLGKIQSLNSLWLTHNELNNLPDEIGQLKNLKNLYIEHNNISFLPDSISNLNKLTVLHAGHNNFYKLPIQLIHLPSLLLLHINNCQISEIPKKFAGSKYSLNSIILNNNKLSKSDKVKWKKEFKSFFIASF